MLERFRQFWTGLLSPIANLLLRLGVSPDVVTLVGTIGVCAGALGFYPRGELFLGTVIITVFVFSDLIDGYMARQVGCVVALGRVARLDPGPDRRRGRLRRAGAVVRLGR